MTRRNARYTIIISLVSPFIAKMRIKVADIPSPVRVDEQVRRKYVALMEVARTNDSSDPVANRFPWQCEIAITQLTDMALVLQREIQQTGKNSHIVIRLRTDSLPIRIYGGPVADRLSQFLDQGGELRLLLTDGVISANSSSLLRYSNRTNVHIRQEGKEKAGVFKNHFFLVDTHAYRFEATHEPFTGSEFRGDDDFHPAVPARICFNDPKGSNILLSTFEELWQDASDKIACVGDLTKSGKSLV